VGKKEKKINDRKSRRKHSYSQSSARVKGRTQEAISESGKVPQAKKPNPVLYRKSEIRGQGKTAQVLRDGMVMDEKKKNE